MNYGNKLTMEELKDFLDSAAQMKKIQDSLFEISQDLRVIRIILMKVFKITSI